MNDVAWLEEVESLLLTGDISLAYQVVSEHLGGLEDRPRAREAVLGAIVPRLADCPPLVSAHLAMIGGAVVESGGPAHALGRALEAPLLHALEAAHRLIVRAGDLDEEDDAEGIEVGERTLSRRQLASLTVDDPEAADAWHSLELWYRPAVAVWSREPALLAAAQASPRLREAIGRLGPYTESSYWLGLLADTALELPFVVLLPELEEAWTFVAHGVSDIGQLSVLVSEPLADPLARIDASGPAPREVLEVMRGEGPQQGDGVYSASFRFYPWQAIDPADGLPSDGRTMWVAPGGTGTHSLPADFQPATIEPLDGVRVLALVGPKARGLSVRREIGAARTFAGLRAELRGVRRLEHAEHARWLSLVRTRNAPPR